MGSATDTPEIDADSMAERSFGIDELFFPITDPGGRMLTGDPVFPRVSAYTAEGLRGRAHNVVRHPDMRICARSRPGSSARAARATRPTSLPRSTCPTSSGERDGRRAGPCAADVLERDLEDIGRQVALLAV